ncbi:methyltransferase domain-containing protein [Rhizobium sp. CRIBSB]|nr:methyltransferase domain-containing protein [Rhizobium sp. CRIBSB]
MADALDLPIWDPEQYNRFEAHRDRAALDLLLRLPAGFDPARIWDLGCGTGAHAALLKRRHPCARVQGLDASAAMIGTARSRPEQVDWHIGNIADWDPGGTVDLILANASLHWLPGHDALLPRLAGVLAPGGVLAVQMPLAHETQHHEILRQVAAEGAWASPLERVRDIAPLLPATTCYDLLADLCEEVDIWTTTYLHALTGPDAVLDWMSGTALRPYLAALDGQVSREPFLSALACALSQAFPMRADGVTLLPFPRLFVVARRDRGTGVA